MEFRVLGPVEVAGADGAVELSARKPRALLAALLMHANEVVSMDALTEALWEEPPASAHKLLQIYVSQLRRAIGQDRIRTRSPGYLLTLGDDELDSARFERLVDSGRAALAAGEALRAKRALNEAASLWRGPPYAEFGYDDFARAEVARLEELRLEALEERI